MTKEQQIKQFILDEIKFREDWREAVANLQELVSPVSKHVRLCCEFWNKNFNNADELIVLMDNGLELKVKRPEFEVAKQEAYLPYGMDFTEIKIIK